MFRRAEVAHDAAGPEPGRGATAAGNFVVDSPWPNLTGDLDTMLTRAPTFRTALRGYDRLEVDNYVAWAESELRAVRRETDDLVTRYGRCSADLEIAQRLLARSPEGQELTVISERMGAMLRLAADEAAELSAAGSAEAEEIIAGARTEADARLRKAAEIKQMAVEASDRMREEARLVRAEAAAEIARARSQAAQLLREAAEERARQQEAAVARIAALQEEIEELYRRREQGSGSLRRLADQIGHAVDVLSSPGSAEVVVPGDGDKVAS
jgi:cell division septum initiation protein DivIVA